ncbi:Galactoside O-acetyltransferase [compost metagenome]
MNGRKIYFLFEPMLLILVFLIKILPYGFRCALYNFSVFIPSYIGAALRFIFLKSALKSVGKNVYVGRYVIIKNFKNLKIGDNVSLHEFCYIDALGEISIGDNVSIAHRSSIISFDHGYDDNNIPIKYNPLCAGKITISNDVWIGAGVTILKDVLINERVIVAAGAVVLNDLVSNHIYGGVPARKLKGI